MPDKFKCPKCGSGRTKPISMAISAGTRRRKTVGLTRRSLWTSTSTYKSDLVSSLPQRPSNVGAYFCIFIGVCGLLFALSIVANVKEAGVFSGFVGFISLLFLLGGVGARKSAGDLAQAQAAWDNGWLCARCGYQWQA